MTRKNLLILLTGFGFGILWAAEAFPDIDSVSANLFALLADHPLKVAYPGYPLMTFRAFQPFIILNVVCGHMLSDDYERTMLYDCLRRKSILRWNLKSVGSIAAICFAFLLSLCLGSVLSFVFIFRSSLNCAPCLPFLSAFLHLFCYIFNSLLCVNLLSVLFGNITAELISVSVKLVFILLIPVPALSFVNPIVRTAPNHPLSSLIYWVILTSVIFSVQLLVHSLRDKLLP